MACVIFWGMLSEFQSVERLVVGYVESGADILRGQQCWDSPVAHVCILLTLEMSFTNLPRHPTVRGIDSALHF